MRTGRNTKSISTSTKGRYPLKRYVITSKKYIKKRKNNPGRGQFGISNVPQGTIHKKTILAIVHSPKKCSTWKFQKFFISIPTSSTCGTHFSHKGRRALINEPSLSRKVRKNIPDLLYFCSTISFRDESSSSATVYFSIKVSHFPAIL